MDISGNRPLGGHEATDVSEPTTTRRQRVVVAGHRGEIDIVVNHVSDPDATVRAAALSALSRLDQFDEARLSYALNDTNAIVRRRAAELGAQHHLGDRATEALRRALSDDDPLVVDAACWALGEAGDTSAIGLLIDLSANHQDIRCREAAVAALGAIGDEAGLPAILARLDDKPTVRRRVVVALASFEGPAVDAALDQCRVDHDWQVRQAVEMLEKEPN